MPAANVRTFERSMVPRVEGRGSVYNAIVIPAKKGPINKPVLVGDENDLLNKFTPDGTIKVGYNIGYYSALAALQQTTNLWVIRAANGALNGGAFVNQEGTTGKTYININETSPELKEIRFDVSNIVDASDKVTISNIQGGTPDELLGRKINIFGVGQVMFTVTDVNGAEITLDQPISSSVHFLGTGTGKIAQSDDFISFDADYGSGGDSDTIEVSNFSSGSSADLLNRVISFVADGQKFTRTVTAVNGSTITVDTNTPSVTDQVGTGYRGFPEVNCTVNDIVDGGTELTISNITPTYITINDFDGKVLEVLADMSDGTTLAISSTVSNPNGATVTFDDGINNPSLVDTSTGEAPYTEAQAQGFEDAGAIPQPVGDLVNFNPDEFYSVMSLFSVNEGDWSKDVRVEILTKNQKTPGTFTINVYTKNDVVRPVETFVCSRDPEAKDGYGRNTFVETVLQASKYINAISNPIIDKDVLPRETVERDSLGNIVSKTFIKFVGGDDGDAVTDSNMIFAAEKMNNKNNYPLTVFMDGGWSSPNYQRKLAEICELRDDSFAVLSIPYEIESNPVTYATDIVEYRNYSLNVNSSYAGIYTSHVKITDKYNDREIFVSPDGFAAAAINLSASNFEIWYPPAGFKRGRLFVNDVHIKFTDSDLDYLADNGINQIRFAPGKGIAIWGQRTLALVPSAFDRINIRLLLNELKPAITKYLEQFLFELNTESVRASIIATITSYLVGIHSRNGISDFKVVCDRSNNTAQDEINNTLNVDVYIQPIYSIEYINFTTVIKNNTVSFSV